ncbi:hypothetical protein [Bradyrhizobium cenepequi]
MAKKKKAARVLWSKDDLKTLKAMAKEKRGRDKIARSLKRSPAAVTAKASNLGISLSTR